MDVICVKRPTEKELDALIFLWKDAFGDSEEYIRSFISSSFYRGCVYAVTDGKIASAVHLTAPGGDERFIYGYAAATLEEYRGRGLCRALHERIFALCREKYSVYGVHPASFELIGLYKKLGMQVSSYRYFSEVEGDGGKWIGISPREYSVMREMYIGALSEEWLSVGGYTTVGFELEGVWCAACLSDGVIWEVLAPPQFEGAASRRAASVFGRARVMTLSDMPMASECALMTYNGEMRDFGLFIE